MIKEPLINDIESNLDAYSNIMGDYLNHFTHLCYLAVQTCRTNTCFDLNYVDHSPVLWISTTVDQCPVLRVSTTVDQCVVLWISTTVDQCPVSTTGQYYGGSVRSTMDQYCCRSECNIIANGVGLSPLYCGHFWPIVPAPDDRWGWLWSNWWKPKYSEKTCPVPLCPPQIPLVQTRDRTRGATVGSAAFGFCHSALQTVPWASASIWGLWMFPGKTAELFLGSEVDIRV
jgi:hypothetical protein